MNNKIKDGSNDRIYRIEIPQIVWSICADTYEFTLWTVVKMIAGEAGECYLSTDDLAAAAMMSTGKASQCRKSLIKKGLMEGEIRKDPGYPQPVWHLTIPDLWPRNVSWRQKNHSLLDRITTKREQRQSLHQMKASPGEEGTSLGEEGTSLGETKKEPERKNQKGKPKNGADAPSAPVPLDPDTAAWIEDLESTEPPPKNPPHSAEEFRQGVIEAEGRFFARMAGEPWLTWGANSTHAQDYFQQLDGKANPVRQLGYAIETELHLIPNWQRKTDVKSWIRGLVACLEATSGDAEIIIQAGRKLRRDEMTISDPWSLVKTARGLYAARQGGQDVSTPTATRTNQRDSRNPRRDRERWTQDEIDARIRTTAEELGEPVS